MMASTLLLCWASNEIRDGHQGGKVFANNIAGSAGRRINHTEETS